MLRDGGRERRGCGGRVEGGEGGFRGRDMREGGCIGRCGGGSGLVCRLRRGCGWTWSLILELKNVYRGERE